jgi:hypothetical protein
MDMKKIIIACFFATLMLLLPLTSVSKDTNNIINNSINEEAPIIYITKDEHNELYNYVNRNYEEPNRLIIIGRI